MMTRTHTKKTGQESKPYFRRKDREKVKSFTVQCGFNKVKERVIWAINCFDKLSFQSQFLEVSFKKRSRVRIFFSAVMLLKEPQTYKRGT